MKKQFNKVWLALVILLPYQLSQAAEPMGEVQFSYEKLVTESHSAAFQFPRDFYSWGEFQLAVPEFRWTETSIHQSDPNNKQIFRVSVQEVVSMEDGGALNANWSSDLELESNSFPTTVSDARGIVANLAAKARAFDYVYSKASPDVPSWRKYATNFSFLGYRNEGHVTVLLDAQNNRQPLKLGDLSCDFTFDEPSRLLLEAKCRISPAQVARPQAALKSPPKTDIEAELEAAAGITQSEKPLSTGTFLGGELTERIVDQTPDSWGWVSTSVLRYSAMPTVETTTKGGVQAVSYNVPLPLEFANAPSNGTKIGLYDDQQIDAEWLDGRIVRVYDGGVAEDLAVAKFRKPSSQNSIWFLIAAVAITAIGGLLYRQRKKNAIDR